MDRRDIRVGMTLIDPNGNFAAYTRPQGDGNHGEVDVAASGRRQVDRDHLPARRNPEQPRDRRTGSSRRRTSGRSTRSCRRRRRSRRGRPRRSPTTPRWRTRAATPTETSWCRAASDTTIVPVTLRSLVTAAKPTFSGNLIGGNGRNGFFQPGQIDTYDIHGPERSARRSTCRCRSPTLRRRRYSRRWSAPTGRPRRASRQRPQTPPTPTGSRCSHPTRRRGRGGSWSTSSTRSAGRCCRRPTAARYRSPRRRSRRAGCRPAARPPCLRARPRTSG